MSRTIIRARRRSGFTVLSNHGLRNEKLSFKAMGLLAYMLSMPDDWKFYVNELEKHATDGRDSIQTGLKELENMGYLVRHQERGKGGQFMSSTWIVMDEPKDSSPQTDLPYTGFPQTDYPETENPQLLSTNSTKNLYIQKTNRTTGSDKSELVESETQRADPPSEVVEVIDHLNEQAGRRFQATSEANQEIITARLNDGASVQDLKNVIDHKAKEWQYNNRMAKYLRPSTLFNRTKFVGYLEDYETTQAQGDSNPMNYISPEEQKAEYQSDNIMPW